MAHSDSDDPCAKEPLTGWQQAVAVAASGVEGSFDQFRRKLKHRLGLTDPVHLQLYSGFGTTGIVEVSGRVLEDEHASPPSAEDTRWQNLVRAYRIFETDEVGGATVEVTFAGQTQEVVSDQEGFFTATFEANDHAFAPGVQEYSAKILRLPERTARFARESFRAGVFIPGPQSDLIVVSDVDDTVMQTEATSLFKMVSNTILNNSYGRIGFPGVGAFYKSLLGDHGRIFYLTSSMWNVYDVIRVFLEVNKIPAGPLLMRDIGLTKTQFFKGTHSAHKLCRVRELLALYPDKRFVLIGDTGQHDAPIYADVAEEAPEQIAAVYLRDLSVVSDVDVAAAVERMEKVGVPVRVADETRLMAEHAVEIGLLDAWAPPAVAEQSETDKAAEE